MVTKKKPGRKRKRPTEKEFARLYIKEGKSAEELAKIYGVSVQTIYNWSSQFRS